MGLFNSAVKIARLPSIVTVKLLDTTGTLYSDSDSIPNSSGTLNSAGVVGLAQTAHLGATLPLCYNAVITLLYITRVLR